MPRRRRSAYRVIRATTTTPAAVCLSRPLPFARFLPDVDAGFSCVLVDLCEFVFREVELVESCDVLFQLADAAGSDEGGRHPLVAQGPGQRHLGERLAAALRDVVQRA